MESNIESSLCRRSRVWDRRWSATDIQGQLLRLVNCFTLFSEFHPLWSIFNCLEHAAPFMKSYERCSVYGCHNPAFASSRSAIPAYQKLPTVWSHPAASDSGTNFLSSSPSYVTFTHNKQVEQTCRWTFSHFLEPHTKFFQLNTPMRILNALYVSCSS